MRRRFSEGRKDFFEPVVLYHETDGAGKPLRQWEKLYKYAFLGHAVFQMDITYYFYFIPALVVAITVHEFMHAWAADRLGDPTARYEGRVSLNPLAHLDPFGTLMLFLIGLGWGKPVPVNPANFQHPMRDQALTALAGPFANLLTAFVVSIPLKYLAAYESLVVVHTFSAALFRLSIILFIFNILPIPPLDGSKILGLIIPDRWHYAYMRFLYDGMKYFVAIIFIDIFVLGRLFGFSVFHFVIITLYEVVATVVLLGT